MRHRIVGYSLAALLTLVLGGGVAIAQAPAGQGAVGTASPQQQVAQSQAFIAGMENVRGSIRRELSDARQQRDVVKTLCLNDKLNQVDVALRSAGERQHALELAAGRGDGDLANHEFTILSVLDQRVKQLDSEAKQCVGKEIGIVGESSTSLDVKPGLPLEDPSEYPSIPTITEPPMCSTCFR